MSIILQILNIVAIIMTFLKEHGFFLERSHLIQGYFENILSTEFKTKIQQENWGIGFAFLDCNLTTPYKRVFEFIFDQMLPHSYIYLDEYYAAGIVTYFD